MANCLISYSSRMDFHKTLDGPEIESVTEHLFSNVCALTHARGKRIRGPEELRRHIKIILLDLFYAYSRRPFLYRGIALSPKNYVRSETRYESVHVSFRYLERVLDEFKAMGLVKGWQGFYDREKQKGYVTRIRATKNLAELMLRYGVNPKDIKQLDRECLVLRDKYGQRVEYLDCDKTYQMRVNLKTINAALKDRRIRLHLPNKEFLELSGKLAKHEDAKQRGPIDYARTSLHRVFNNSSFMQGGRFYGGWWQGIPREYRKHITIDFKETIEVDYSSMHIRMLYAEESLPVPDEPYDLTNFPREHQKLAILYILNAASRRKAAWALKDKLGIDVRPLLAALMERHRPIANHFFSGRGVHLQWLDSQIAERVLLKIISKGGIALPVHDSFLVRIGREDELKEAMDEAFNELFSECAATVKAQRNSPEVKEPPWFRPK